MTSGVAIRWAVRERSVPPIVLYATGMRIYVALQMTTLNDQPVFSRRFCVHGDGFVSGVQPLTRNADGRHSCG